MQKVPVLDDNGFVLTERWKSIYLEQTKCCFYEKHLPPHSPNFFQIILVTLSQDSFHIENSMMETETFFIFWHVSISFDPNSIREACSFLLSLSKMSNSLFFNLLLIYLQTYLILQFIVTWVWSICGSRIFIQYAHLQIND